MDNSQEKSNKPWIIGCLSATGVIIAAIIGLGVPFAERLADVYFPSPMPSAIVVAATQAAVQSFTPTENSSGPTQIQPIAPTQMTIATSLPQPVNQPTIVLNQTQPPNLCYGQCWQYNDNTRTMTWTGLTDGTEDIWQPPGDPLQKLRIGYSVILSTTVPGEIFACVLTINGKVVKNSCDGVLYQVPPGTYQITSSNNNVGGFRWCPLVGYGWRKNGGECR
jgi:hypothetical protein